ncbi:hypothetical protein [Psychrobacter sp. ASPA161_6]|uniref:hypothetical protein n=1 Tax=Psychrobacter sp. ASPA161_6 TaxID=3160962 RepID=UPI003F802B23
MSQIRSFLIDSLAYVLANRKLGHRITHLSDEMVRLRDTEFSISTMVLPGPWDENGPMRGGRNIELARKALKKSKDPRYISNPLYSPMKHERPNGHYLFDELRKSEPEQSGWRFLNTKTIVSVDGQEFELLESVQAMPNTVAKVKEGSSVG